VAVGVIVLVAVAVAVTLVALVTAAVGLNVTVGELVGLATASSAVAVGTSVGGIRVGKVSISDVGDGRGVGKTVGSGGSSKTSGNGSASGFSATTAKHAPAPQAASSTTTVRMLKKTGEPLLMCLSPDDRGLAGRHRH
jgi:hypothetical protein